MDWNKLSVVGGFLGGIASLGGLVLALVSYFDPIEITVLPDPPLNPRTAERISRLIGLWVADPIEIFTEVDEAWLANRAALGKNFYNPTVVDASVRFRQGDRQDELVGDIVLINSVFDHRFRATVRVAGDDLRVGNVKHQRQYGAEPDLKVSSSGMEITVPKGMLYVTLDLAEYAEISFWAEPRTR